MARTSDITAAPIKPTISKADLDKVDVRVGTIRSVEDVAHSDKLVRLLVDFGDHRRTILVGMKGERADVREIEPKRMAGEVSEALLFDLGYADRIAPALAVPERSVPNGVRAG